MLPIKSKYKIAKRLGAGIFEQTQTQKFALSEARARASKKTRRSRGGSDYGKQLLEKQRVRFTYGITEKQLSNYAHAATHEANPSAALHSALERRVDNTVYRVGLAPTRRAARQMVSHGHVMVNGKRTTIPGQELGQGDVITVREGSRVSPLFASLAEAQKESSRATPKWITFDVGLLRAEITGEPSYDSVIAGLDYATVFEFYSR